MSRAKILPLVLVAILFAVSLSAIASDTHETPKTAAEPPEQITIPMYGGTVTMPVDFEAGDRFLQLVEPPVFTRTEQALETRGLQPGDRGDQGGEEPIVLERRVTDYSYMQENWTGGMRLNGVSGTPDAYICVCDATFIMTNETGLDDTRPIRAIDSEYLWFDNITMYGGAIDFIFSNNLIVSNSLFIDSSAVGSFHASHGYVHNISVIMQRPPTNLIHHPPETLPGIPHGKDFMCWPHVEPPPCQGGGVFLGAGEDWVVEWSYFHGAGGAGTVTNTDTIILRHNTFRDTALGVSGGTNEISWNLIRGTQLGGASMIACATCYDTLEHHNNSVIMPFKIDHGVPGINAGPGLWIQNCNHCNIKDNDFIGYGVPDYSQTYGSGSELRYPALLARHSNYAIANDNYWGTLHNPQLPPDWWIRITHPEQTTLILDQWDTQPNHDITPIMYTLDTRDIPYWADQITGLPVQDTLDELPTP